MKGSGNPKKIPTAELVAAMQEVLHTGRKVTVLVSGSSMLPFLVHCRDSVTVSPSPGFFRRGDIVFYQRSSGAFVMHRIVGVSRCGALTLCGDAQVEKEYPIWPGQVFGVVLEAERKGRRIDRRCFVWWFFRYPWRWLRPIRRQVMRGYQRLFSNKK